MMYVGRILSEAQRLTQLEHQRPSGVKGVRSVWEEGRAVLPCFDGLELRIVRSVAGLEEQSGSKGCSVLAAAVFLLISELIVSRVEWLLCCGVFGVSSLCFILFTN